MRVNTRHDKSSIPGLRKEERVGKTDWLIFKGERIDNNTVHEFAD